VALDCVIILIYGNYTDPGYTGRGSLRFGASGGKEPPQQGEAGFVFD
jgi:hypothetical protein